MSASYVYLLEDSKHESYVTGNAVQIIDECTSIFKEFSTWQSATHNSHTIGPWAQYNNTLPAVSHQGGIFADYLLESTI